MASEREIAFAQYWEGKEGRKLTVDVVRHAYLAGWSDKPAFSQHVNRDRLIGNLLDRWEMTPNDLKEEMREHGCGKQLDALMQAPPPQTNVEPVRLKPLEWKTLVCSDRHAEVADSVLGRWEMWSFSNGSTHIMKPGEHQGSVYEDTPEEAKAYLERVYQRRMAPALATTEDQDNG